MSGSAMDALLKIVFQGFTIEEFFGILAFVKFRRGAARNWYLNLGSNATPLQNLRWSGGRDFGRFGSALVHPKDKDRDCRKQH